MTVAMLGAIESLMSAMVADRMTGDRHDSNVELIAQGVANIASPLFGGLPATGAIARTATNIRAGAQTPVAGIIHALTLAVILIVAAPLARYVPLAVLAAILLVVAYNMGDWAEIPELLRLTKTDVIVWMVTFALTVFADLTQAVGVGMVCAALLFIKRVADTTTVTAVTDDYVEAGHVTRPAEPDHPVICENLPHPRSVSVRGHRQAAVRYWTTLQTLPPIIILRLRNMTALDATGLRAFEELAQALHASGRLASLVRRTPPAGEAHRARRFPSPHR